MHTIGIGFGPANMALAIAIKENQLNAKDTIFFDKRESFSWHSGLMFNESTIQVSFLKDLVTMVNPQSEYTFLNYIKESGRMHEFINLGTFFPRRTEFNGYLQWVGEKLKDMSKFNEEIVDIKLANEKDIENSLLEVSVKNTVTGNIDRLITKNIVIADGGKTHWPIPLDQGSASRVFHGEETISRLKSFNLDKNKKYTFHIVGAGQSAADIMDYLANEYPLCEIIITHKSFSIVPEDDSFFVNEIFMPKTVEMFLSMSQDNRNKVLQDNKLTTHNGVTMTLIGKIYEKMYYDMIDGKNTYNFNRFSEVINCEEKGDFTISKIKDLLNDETYEIESDFTIMATGYKRECPHPLLAKLDNLLLTIDDDSFYDIDENYRINTSKKVNFNIYLQGYAENTHGFSETLLSLMAERAYKIAKKL